MRRETNARKLQKRNADKLHNILKRKATAGVTTRQNDESREAVDMPASGAIR